VLQRLEKTMPLFRFQDSGRKGSLFQFKALSGSWFQHSSPLGVAGPRVYQQAVTRELYPNIQDAFQVRTGTVRTSEGSKTG